MSEAINPYAAPRAEVADVFGDEVGVQPVKYFSAQGRIGRLRLLCYSMVGYILFAILAFVVSFIVGLAAGKGAIAGVVGIVLLIPYLVFYVLLMIQRSHDMDWSGWTWLLALIPLVGLIWIFNPGTRGANRYGAPPPPNGTGVVVGALVFPVIVIIGILAAVALPAYQQYTVKAKAAQLQMQKP